MFTLEDALEELVKRQGSDLHLHVGNRPLVRIDGRLRPISDDAPVLKPGDTLAILHHILPDTRMKEFENEHELDFAYGMPGTARFRVNAFIQRGSVTIVMRALPYDIPTADELGLPEVVTDIAHEERGIILVTGTTGSGKSTTLAAMIEQINKREEKHIVTIEDPIEYLHRDANCEVNQREVGSDTE